MQVWQWFKRFTRVNKKLVTGIGAALLVSVGAPVYLAQPVANGIIETITTDDAATD